MIEHMKWKKLSSININDAFFDSLRNDYGKDDFNNWFLRKANEGKNALTFYDGDKLLAFLFLQRQEETIQLEGSTLQTKRRLKISTFKLSDEISNQRMGEGLIGVALWYWQRVEETEIFVTAFEKQKKLIGILEKFGFVNVGKMKNNECVFIRNKNSIDFSTPYTSFPYISSSINKAGLIPINDKFHDRLFPYSDSLDKNQEIEEITAGNGITKVYIGCPYSITKYSENEVVGIYRIHTGQGKKGDKSAISSFCTITKVDVIKKDNISYLSLEEYLHSAGNKTVFTESELKSLYNQKNVVMIEMVYNGFFKRGKNVTYNTLKSNKLFENHPYNIEYSFEQFKKILELGGANIENIIID